MDNLKLIQMKNLLISVFFIGILFTVFSCFIDSGEDGYSNCNVLLTNNSDYYLYVGEAFTLYPSTWNRLDKAYPYFNYLGIVYKHSTSKRRQLEMRGVGPYKDKDLTWYAFFRDMGIDSFQIVVSKDFDDLFKWRDTRNDSLLLKKYTFTLPDLQNEQNTVSITYP